MKLSAIISVGSLIALGGCLQQQMYQIGNDVYERTWFVYDSSLQRAPQTGEGAHTRPKLESEVKIDIADETNLSSVGKPVVQVKGGQKIVYKGLEFRRQNDCLEVSWHNVHYIMCPGSYNLSIDPATHKLKVQLVDRTWNTAYSANVESESGVRIQIYNNEDSSTRSTSDPIVRINRGQRLTYKGVKLQERDGYLEVSWRKVHYTLCPGSYILMIYPSRNKCDVHFSGMMWERGPIY